MPPADQNVLSPHVITLTSPVVKTRPGAPITAKFLRSVEKEYLQERHLNNASISPGPAKKDLAPSPDLVDTNEDGWGKASKQTMNSGSIFSQSSYLSSRKASPAQAAKLSCVHFDNYLQKEGDLCASHFPAFAAPCLCLKHSRSPGRRQNRHPGLRITQGQAFTTLVFGAKSSNLLASPVFQKDTNASIPALGLLLPG